MRMVTQALNALLVVLGVGGLTLALMNGGTGWIITTVALLALIVAGVTNVASLRGDIWGELEIVGGLQQGANGVCLFAGAMVVLAGARLWGGASVGVIAMYGVNALVLIAAPVLTALAVRRGRYEPMLLAADERQ